MVRLVFAAASPVVKENVRHFKRKHKYVISTLKRNRQVSKSVLLTFVMFLDSLSIYIMCLPPVSMEIIVVKMIKV